VPDAAKREVPREDQGEHFDVVIVGAGISGVGAAHHLQEQCPDRSFVILESLESFGGTWWTHRYPGARSDSDLYTYGYRFKPWTGAPIASKDEILTYMADVIEDDSLEAHIRCGHTVTRATWSSDEKKWKLDVVRTTGEYVSVTADFLWMCQGYYRQSQGHTPEWLGLENFLGPVVHPQTWRSDLEYADKDVLVIGSGATAATLIPAIANQCRHVTMLQRSPTFFYIRTNVNEVADMLRQLDIPDEWVHEIVRQKIVLDAGIITQLALDYPELAREELLKPIREILGESYDIDTHFNPRYRPWQQRIAVVPDGDLFQCIRDGTVTVVTDEIDSFNETGVNLTSGKFVQADVVVTATGFNMNVLGDIEFIIDGSILDFAKTITYRGLMFTGLPNLVEVFGYYRSSWTLRVDLIGDFVCRLLNHMKDLGVGTVVPGLRAHDEDMALRPWVDPEEFNAGYLLRALEYLPQQGDKDPWRNALSYEVEKVDLPVADLDDGTLLFN
jgi:cation diffusion facilitator CzcD-associated flavoprotein CzcO